MEESRVKVVALGKVDRERYLRLIQDAQDKLDALEIPYGKVVHWTINTRARRRLGQCEKIRTGIYTIELAEKLFEASDHSVEEVILHELLHSCEDARGHGAVWQRYAQVVNQAYHFHISTYGNEKALGIVSSEEERLQEYKYAWRCNSCQALIGYYRKTQIVSCLLGEKQSPGQIHCKCGGTVFTRIK